MHRLNTGSDVTKSKFDLYLCVFQMLQFYVGTAQSSKHIVINIYKIPQTFRELDVGFTVYCNAPSPDVGGKSFSFKVT